ncbi:MAG: transposase, partial [Chloroflexi bacterium]|nr:transposase [Chloroflexota bacterium]
ASYFQFYNQERPHQALAYRTPAQVYLAAQARPTATSAVERWATGGAPVVHPSTAATTTVFIPDSTKGNRTLAQPIFVS